MPGFSTSSEQPLPGAAGYYNQLLGLNQQNYANINSGYQRALSGLQGGLNSIYGGYDTTQNNMLAALGQQGQAGQADIANEFQTAMGKANSQLQSRGLAGSTVLPSLYRGSAQVAAQESGRLREGLGQLYSGVYGDIGKAKLGAMQQGQGLLANLSNNYLSGLSHFDFRNTFGNLYGPVSRSSSAGGEGGGGGSMGGGGMGGVGGLEGMLSGMGGRGGVNYGGGGGFGSAGPQYAMGGYGAPQQNLSAPQTLYPMRSGIGSNFDPADTSTEGSSMDDYYGGSRSGVGSSLGGYGPYSPLNY